jgi:hypothetical protein
MFDVELLETEQCGEVIRLPRGGSRGEPPFYFSRYASACPILRSGK